MEISKERKENLIQQVVVAVLSSSAGLLTLVTQFGFLNLVTQFDLFNPKRSHYLMLSDSILASGVLGFGNRPSTAFEPVYPLFLSLMRWASPDNYFLIILIQVCVHAATAVVFYKVCRLLSHDNQISLIAGVLYSLYPYYVRQSCAIIDFSLLMFCLMVAVYFYLRSSQITHACMSGIFFGLATLTRFTAAPLILFAFVYLALRKKIIAALILLCSAAIIIAPYLIRNYRIDQSLSPTRFGFNLFRSNNERAAELFPGYTADILDSYAIHKLKKDRPATGIIHLPYTMGQGVDRYFLSQALEYVKSDPIGFLKLKAYNFFYIFYPRLTPLYQNSRIINADLFIKGEKLKTQLTEKRHQIGGIGYSIFYALILVGFIWGVYIRRGSLGQETILWLVFINFVLHATLFFAYTRHKAPMDFVLMYYAAYALKQFFSYAGRARHRDSS